MDNEDLPKNFAEIKDLMKHMQLSKLYKTYNLHKYNTRDEFLSSVVKEYRNRESVMWDNIKK